MPVYTLTETDRFSNTSISSNMFGTNFVTSFDFEFVQNSGALDLLGELGITVLRFPGGSVTEEQFANLSFISGNWGVDSYLDANGNAASLTTLNDFFLSASVIDADVQLVIPTRVAFEESAGQALNSGSYGARVTLDENYFDWLDAFVLEALSEGQSAGVEVVRFEIGNEFWGSGQMTASEYGYLSAEITAHLSAEFPNIEIIVQVVASANQYSPLTDQTAYLEPVEDGDFIVHRGNTGVPVGAAGWIQVTIPGQGNVTSQVVAIAGHFNNNQSAWNNLSGIVDHVYFDAGFAGIDSQRDFALNYPYNVFSNETRLTDLDYFVTEWSPRNAASSSSDLSASNEAGNGNANGLQLAHTTIEAFFELSSNGVNGANFWPLTFANPNVDSRVLIDTSELDLTFSGVAFQMLAGSVSGLQPFLDFEVNNVIDVHGFHDETRIVLFVGERSGQVGTGSQIDLRLGEFAASQQYFVNVTTLNSDDGYFDRVDSDPSVEFENGYVLRGDIINMELNAWDISRVELQAITNQADQIYGRSGNDVIVGLGGDDIIGGGGGSNRLDGGAGRDIAVFAGNQSDYTVTQHERFPLIWYVSNGEETDTLRSFEALQFADTFIYLPLANGGENLESTTLPEVSPGEGSLVRGSTHNLTFGNPQFRPFTGENRQGNGASNLLVTGAQNDRLFGRSGNDRIDSGGGSDKIYGGSGKDTILGRGGDDWAGGGKGNDLILTGGGNDVARGWSGDDDINGGYGDDQIYGEAGNDRLQGHNGNDRIDGGDGDNKLFGQSGDDRLIAGAGSDSMYGGGGNDLIKGRSGDDRLEGGTGADKLLGGGGNDVLTGQQGEDHLGGSYGDDFMYGGGGDDLLAGQQGNDRIEGGTGADHIFGGGGGDILVGNEGHDVIHGGIGSDFLGGGSGDDTLNGFTGDDRLVGSFGKDNLFGGDGADILAGQQDHDWIDGGNGNDRLFGGSGHDMILGQAGQDQLFGMNEIDQLYGGSGNDQLYGGSGNDQLYGGSGNDQLYGGSGNDVLFAVSGRNTLSGWTGNDVLHGGVGPDRFVLTSGADEIFNFETDRDTISIDSDLWNENISPSDIGYLFGSENASGVLLDFGEGNSLQINGITDLAALDNLISFL